MTKHTGGAKARALDLHVAVTLLVALAGASSPILAQNNSSDSAKLIDVLQLKAGHVVAEIGAGGGELTVSVARHVGPAGRVMTSELGAGRLAKLRDAVTRSGASNVEVVEGHESHANLPDGCCDAVFMRNVYHHFSDPPTMNASIFRALKPGARVAVIDFSPRNNVPIASPGRRGDDSAHGVSVDVVSSELKAAGFQIVTTEDRGERWFLVVASKPN
jgi:predicted methyltransferase